MQFMGLRSSRSLTHSSKQCHCYSLGRGGLISISTSIRLAVSGSARARPARQGRGEGQRCAPASISSTIGLYGSRVPIVPKHPQRLGWNVRTRIAGSSPVVPVQSGSALWRSSESPITDTTSRHHNNVNIDPRLACKSAMPGTSPQHRITRRLTILVTGTAAFLACFALALAGVASSVAAPLVWGTPQQIDSEALQAVACPSTSLCVAVGYKGDIVTSTDPAATIPTWTAKHVDGAEALSAISCPTTGLCVAVGSDSEVLTIHDPGAGTSASMSVVEVGKGVLTGVSCISETLCVAVSNEGDVLTSTEPTGGAAAWPAEPVSGASRFTAVACVGKTFCVAVDNHGDVATSTDVAAGAKSWTSSPTSTEELNGVSCPSSTFCVAIGYEGDIVGTSSDPTGGGDAWHFEQLQQPNQPNGLRSAACASAQLCVATTYDGSGSEGNIVVSTDPAGGHETWVEENVLGNPVVPRNPILPLYVIDLTGVSCPTDGMCVIVSAHGDEITGTAIPPANTSPPTTTGKPAVGQVLKCSDGSWTGTPAPSFTYQWLRDGIPITGADAGTYTVQQTDQGNSLACQVTATNIAGSASATSESVSVPAEIHPPGGSPGSSQGGNGPPLTRAKLDTIECNKRQKITIRLTVPAGGVINVVARSSVSGGATGAKHTAHHHRFTIATRVKRVTSGRQITTTLTLSKQAKAILRSQGKLATTVTIKYTPTSGDDDATRFTRQAIFSETAKCRIQGAA